MSDDLRTRIAKVLYRCDYGLRDWEKATDEGKQAYYDDADVLIRELGLRQESSFISGDDGRQIRVSEWDRKQFTKPPPNGWQHRYVTSWETE